MNIDDFGICIRWEMENFLIPTNHIDYFAETTSFKFDLFSEMTWKILLGVHNNIFTVRLKREFNDYIPLKLEVKLKLEIDDKTDSCENFVTFDTNDSFILFQSKLEEFEQFTGSRKCQLSCNFWYENLVRCAYALHYYFLTHFKIVKVKHDWLIHNINELHQEELNFPEFRVYFSLLESYKINFKYDCNTNMLKIQVVNLPDLKIMSYFHITPLNCHGEQVGLVESIGTKSVDGKWSYEYKIIGINGLPIVSHLPDNILNLSITINGSIGETITYCNGCLWNRDIIRKGDVVKELKPLFHHNQNTDVSVWYRSRQFVFGKGYLRALSPEFNSVLNTSSSFVIQDAGNDFERCLITLQLGEIPEQPRFEFISNLFLNSRIKNIEPLKRATTRIIISMLSLENVCDVLLLLKEFYDPGVSTIAVIFFKDNLKLILNTNGWKNFLEKDPKLAYRFLHAAFETEVQDIAIFPQLSTDINYEIGMLSGE